MAMERFRKMDWHEDNVKKGKVPNLPGIYKMYDGYGRMIYTGHAHRLRHRLQSYYQDDCFRTHPTKARLRQHIDSFSFKVMPVKKARMIEKRIKKKAIYNYK
jgi:excinuclease UvrABC nuclease subunit